MWLWLWHGLAAAALIHPLAWKFPYAVGAAVKRERQTEIWLNDAPTLEYGISASFFFFVFWSVHVADLKLNPS